MRIVNRAEIASERRQNGWDSRHFGRIEEHPRGACLIRRRAATPLRHSRSYLGEVTYFEDIFRLPYAMGDTPRHSYAESSTSPMRVRRDGIDTDVY
jgi:hypothetical protein